MDNVEMLQRAQEDMRRRSAEDARQWQAQEARRSATERRQAEAQRQRQAEAQRQQKRAEEIEKQRKAAEEVEKEAKEAAANKDIEIQIQIKEKEKPGTEKTAAASAKPAESTAQPQVSTVEVIEKPTETKQEDTATPREPDKKEDGGPRPPPPPKEGEPQVPHTGDVDYVSPTTDPDKYQVRYSDGTWGTLTRDQVIAAGGEIPIPGQSWGTGEGLQFSRGGEGGITEKDFKEVLGFDFNDPAYKDMIEKFKNNPLDPAFIAISKEQRDYLAKALNIKYDPIAAAEQQYLHQLGIAQEQQKNLMPVGNNIDIGTFQKMVIQEYADKHQISWQEAQALLEKIREEPNSPDIKKLTADDREELSLLMARVAAGRDFVKKEDFEKLQKTDPDLAQTLKTGGIHAMQAEIAGKERAAWDNFGKLLRDGDPQKDIMPDEESFKSFTEAGGGPEGFKAVQDLIKQRVVTFENNLRKDDPEGFKVYESAGGGEKGFVAYQGLVNQRLKDFESEIEKPDYPAELRNAYKKGGFDSWEEAVREYNAAVARQNAMAAVTQERYESAINRLQPYLAGKDEEGNDTYNVDRFIYDHPNSKSLQTLIDAGFSEEAIRKANEYVKTTGSAMKEIGTLYKDNKDIVSGKAIAIESALREAGVKLAEFPYPQDLKLTAGWGTNVFVDEKTGKVYFDYDVDKYRWDQLTDEEKEKVAGIYGSNLYRGNYFAAMTHEMEKTAADAGLAGAIVFSPILGITSPIAKASTGQEVSPMEWAVAGATAAIDFLMVGGAGLFGAAAKAATVGRGMAAAAKAAHTAQTAALVGLSTGAGAVFTYDTVQNWENMSNPERALAVTMDALMFLPITVVLAKKSIGLLTEPNLATKQMQSLQKIFENAREKFGKLAGKGPQQEEFAARYSKWMKDLQRYGEAQLKLSQAQEALNAIEFPKTQGEIAFVKQAKIRLQKLQSDMPALKEKVLQSSKALTDLQKDVLGKFQKEGKIIEVGADDAMVLEEMSRLGERSVKDMQDIAQQLVHPRDIKAIKADIEAAIKEISPTKKYLTRVTLPEKGGGTTKGLVSNSYYLNQLNRELYMAKLSNLNRIYENVLQAQEMAKELKYIKDPKARAELEAKINETMAKSVEMKQKLFEGMEKTTEPVEGKGDLKYYKDGKLIKTEEYELQQSYSGIIERLEGLRQKYISRIKDTQLKKDFEGALKDYEWAIKYKDMQLLQPAKQRLQLLGRELPPELEFKQWQRALNKAFKAEDVYLKTEGKPSINVKEATTRIKTAENEIKAYERAIERAKTPAEKAKLRDLLDLMKKQQEREKKLLTQVKVKIKMPTQKIAKPGENLPAKIEQGEKTITKSKPTERISQEAQKKLDEIRRKIEEKPASAPEKTRPGALPAKRTSATPAHHEELAPLRGIPLTEAMPFRKHLTRVKEFTKPFPMTVTEPRISTRTRTGIIPLIHAQPLTESQIKALTITKLSPQTMPLILTQPQTQTQPVTKTGLVTQTIPQTKTEPSEKTETTTKLGIGTPVETAEEETQKRPIKKGGGSKKEEPWTPEQIQSAIKWKDGIVIHAIKAPYRTTGEDSRSFSIHNLPAGLDMKDVIEIKGPESQEKSAKVTGKFPARLTVDVGNQDLEISRAPGRRLKFKFTHDKRGSVSQTTIKKPGANISKKRGRMFHTRMPGGGTVISRRPFKGY